MSLAANYIIWKRSADQLYVQTAAADISFYSTTLCGVHLQSDPNHWWCRDSSTLHYGLEQSCWLAAPKDQAPGIFLRICAKASSRRLLPRNNVGHKQLTTLLNQQVSCFKPTKRL
ncbi:hypothetical protein CSKR_203879 [Clonorchis sinensis]|uniref:Uncharacterized protein n=1 Tax=Clonorchis sinensis TaxID=79923 RepID=A0A8T1N2A2_CLOSI|nr:hypothetical protein CSKR_203879 [Clonorchis sinensis]